ncbi:hypothetical protein [Azospirillum palustre]
MMDPDKMLARSRATANADIAKPAPDQPLLGEALDRLRRVRDGLTDANGRIGTVADRIHGIEPQKACGGAGNTAPDPRPLGMELMDMIHSIALQVEHLHDVASRVERIG